VDLYWENSLYEQLDAEGRYHSTLLALLTLIKAESLCQPVILFVEDVQFIDEDSLNFLPRLKRSIQADERMYPVAIIATSRVESNNPVLNGDLVDVQLRLGGLQREAVARLVEVLLGGVPSVELVNLIMHRSEGNPYFVEQIIRYLQDEKLIEMSARGWTQLQHVRESFLPGDIGALLVARLDQLSRKVKETVQTASVFGREFLLAVLSEMTAEGDAIEKHVLEAEQSAIWVGNEARQFIFTHGLLRDAAYTMQMRARIRELHGLALAALERIYADDLKFHYVELAYHAERADLREKALQYYILAGKSASAAFQNAKGVEYLTSALAFCPPEDLVTRFELLCLRIDLYDRMAHGDLQWNDLNELTAIANEIGEATYISKVQMLFTNYFFFVGKYREAVETAQQAFATPGHTTEPEVFFLARMVWFLGLLRLGRLDDAMPLALETLEIARGSGDRRQLGRVLAQVGFAAFEQSEPAAAGEYLYEALQIASELNDRKLQTRVFLNLAMFETGVHGDLGKAAGYYHKTIQVAREIGDRSSESKALGNLGFVAGLRGDFQEAISYLEKALIAAREMGENYHQILLLVNLSANAGIQDQPKLAAEYAGQAIALAQQVGERSGEAWGWMYLGYAQLAMDQVEPARTAFEQSVQIRQEMGQASLSMEPLAGLVEVGMRTGDLELAASITEKILGHLQSGGTLNGTDEPLRIYYSCYRLLEKKQDPRSTQVLQDALQMLDAQLAKLHDERARQMYVENVPWRLALRRAAADQK
jgi:tetratricopeptide (TPR) repeat protein